MTAPVKPPRSKGRTGRPFRRLRDRLKASGAPCWVCGHHIDLTLPWWDPWSFSVDHIVPLTVDQSKALVWENLASAHRRCNQIRGYGTVPVGPVEGTVRASRAW